MPADTVLFPLFTNFTKIFQSHFQETEGFSLVKDLVLPTRRKVFDFPASLSTEYVVKLSSSVS